MNYDEQFKLGVVLRHKQTKRLIIIVRYNLAGNRVVRNIQDDNTWILYKKYFYLYEIVEPLNINYPLNKLVQYIRDRSLFQNDKLDNYWNRFKKELLKSR